MNHLYGWKSFHLIFKLCTDALFDKMNKVKHVSKKKKHTHKEVNRYSKNSEHTLGKKMKNHVVIGVHLNLFQFVQKKCSKNYTLWWAFLRL